MDSQYRGVGWTKYYYDSIISNIWSVLSGTTTHRHTHTPYTDRNKCLYLNPPHYVKMCGVPMQLHILWINISGDIWVSESTSLWLIESFHWHRPYIPMKCKSKWKISYQNNQLDCIFNHNRQHSNRVLCPENLKSSNFYWLLTVWTVF